VFLCFFAVVRCDLCIGHVVPEPFALLLLLGAFGHIVFPLKAELQLHILSADSRLQPLLLRPVWAFPYVLVALLGVYNDRDET
jgi:hypothetical protein